MKRFREFRTQGDFFYMEVNFLPETEEDEQELYNGFVTQNGPNGAYALRLSWLLRYPKDPGTLFRPRFCALAHANLSPVIVAEESAYFLDLIFKMIKQ